ncbi:hypothetical protein EPUS_02099 [Endocarpon pusillum Z07020]|uniref:Aminoglycoside phosphotransferase domain-containing protein n=1 Tax=Endocarpon pusillum (strain Z07020 / HMAS-L-300199) TaxID=1263415 RepID=U1G4I2_ENDPU|nr:uncharacterized protein EPUS_02099 [Endocarpon pusillum Z07020]ERF72212.1 hypothetical protein EPUS_02099 [Endocarpon pusillum Z07020]
MAGEIRQPIDIAALEKYVKDNVPEIKTPLKVKQFGFGQSNPTYQLTSPNGAKYVMRKKPPGTLLSKTAHQVEREYRIIHALERTDVPVPKAYCLCEDAGVVGTPFYIMEFMDGRIVTEAWFPDVSVEERTEMWRSAILTLASLHRVPPSSVNLSNFGKSSGFYDRQLKTFGTISLAQSHAVDVDTKIPVGKIPHFDDMVSFFSEKPLQPQDRATLVHGDYKIDNLVFHKTEPRVIGILDWEMATIGHPLSDLVNLTGPYSWMRTPALPSVQSAQQSIEIGHGTAQPEFTPGVIPGLPTLEQCLKWYAEAAGWDPAPDLGWGNAFGGFRGAVIMQGIAARYALRQASGKTAKTYVAQMGPYGEWAWGMVENLKKEKEAEKTRQSTKARL